VSEQGLLVLMGVTGPVSGALYLFWLWWGSRIARSAVQSDSMHPLKAAAHWGVRLGVAADLMVLALLGPQVLLRGESFLWVIAAMLFVFLLQMAWVLTVGLRWLMAEGDVDS